ncbi:MAG TPA: hypothetical protein VFA41_12850 [Ktedonobacteraceae bacterium]|jgi:hypothetical protein|nr:hypothetical protein [Ktedonobacteraceae bacterium]
MLNIERYDKQPEPRITEIQPDWRAWAEKSGYTQTSSILVEQDSMHVLLEILENPAEKDPYLLYVPPIPKTTGGETLYIISDQEQLTFMMDAAQKMVRVAMLMAQEKLRRHKAHLN